MNVSDPARTVVFVTALSLEHAAISAHLTDLRQEAHPAGTVYERGLFHPGKGGNWDIVVVEAGPGNTAAALEFERAINHYHPSLAFFVGVAGGLKDVSLGDVVAATKVYGYESGKERETFQPRPVVQQSSYRLVQHAKAVAHDGHWRNRIVGGVPDPAPQARVGPIAAGEKVVASTQSPTHELLRDTYGDALAVEMEGFGFLYGAYANQAVTALVVRGISDLIEGKDETDAGGWQERAARHASAFCFELLAQLASMPVRDVQDALQRQPGEEAPSAKGRALFGASWRHSLKRAFGLLSSADLSGASPASGRTLNTEEAALNAKMDSVRTMIQDGHFQAARSGLERIEQQIAGMSPSAEFMTRLGINRGVCALLLDDLATAEREFKAALTYDPNSQKALANLAQVALMQERPAEGLRYSSEARAKGPTDSRATGVYLHALHDCDRDAELQQVLDNEPWILNDPCCCLFLGLIAYENGEYTKAEDFLGRTLAHDRDDAQAIELLARVVFAPVQAALERNPPLPWKMDASVRAKLEQAEALFRRAVEILSRQDHAGLFRAAVANHGMALSILGRDEEALQQYDRVLAEDPFQPQVLENKARSLLSMGRPQEAAASLDQCPGEKRQTARRLHALAYMAARQPQKALQLLVALSDEPQDSWEKIRVAELLLDCYSALGQPSKGQEIADRLRSEYRDDAEALAVVAEWTASLRRVEEAVALFYEALAHADPIQRDRITLTLANFYHKQNRFAEAAQLYQSVVDTTSDRPFLRRYLICLFNSRSYQRALELAQQIRGKGRAIPVVSAIEARVLEAAGDVAGAKRLLAELADAEPDNPDHRIRLAFLHYRGGDTAAAEQAVRAISPDELQDNPDQLMDVAKVRAWLGLGGVLPLAYRARRAGFDRADIHQAYVSLFLGRDKSKDPSLERTQVRPGCAVRVRLNGNQQRTYVVVDGLDADLHRGELLPSDPLAQKLCGCSKGDRVSVKRTPLEEVSFEIEEISSQYVFAFRDTLLNFSNWFPEANGPARLPANDEGLTKMFAMLDRRQQQAEAILSMYRANRLTLRMLGRLMGCSVIATWEALQSSDDYCVRAASGSGQETAGELAALTGCEAIVLDLSAVLTMGSLGHLDKLKRRFRRVIAPQFVYDEIRDELTLEASGLRPYGWIGRVGDRYVMTEPPLVRTDGRQRFLESLLSFLQHEVELLPALDALPPPGEGQTPQDNPCGVASLAAILIAKREKALLHSDDLVLRVLAHNSWQVSSTWSQNVLRELRRSGSLGEAEYHRAVSDLVLNRYYFVSADENDYYWLLEQESWQLTPRITRALRLFEGPDCTDHSAVHVLTEFLRKVWLTPHLHATRALILDACIAALRKGRNARVILPLFEARVRARFNYMPDAAAEILTTSVLWGQEKRLERGEPLRAPRARVAAKSSRNAP